jgi:hypothetical protein
MNTAIALGIGIEGIVVLVLGIIVAIRAKRQCGFLAPLGFVCAVLLDRVCHFLSIPLIKRMAEEADQDKMREAVSKMSDDDRLFYLGLSGQTDAIWSLGALLFLLCGWLDLKMAGSDVSKGSRWALIAGGSLLIVISVFYPIWMQQRIG